MFTRLFKPRWEHSDPRIRRKAFESGDAPAQAVVEAARSDTDLEVRQCAVQRLADLDLLAELAGSDASAAIREAAGRRQRALLAGPLQDGPPLEARLQAVRRLPSPELCAFLARQAEVAELRSAALAQVQDIELLCAVAVDDPVAAVRRAALERIEATQSSSFACDLRKWLEIMQAYENGGHAYHATMPTDALKRFRDTMNETEAYGFERVRDEQIELGRRVRELLEGRGFRSVAAAGFQAPGVVVSYTEDPEIQNGSKFREQGLQIAAGVPLMCDEGDDYRSFRIGLFGLDKLHNIDRTVGFLAEALDRLGGR